MSTWNGADDPSEPEWNVEDIQGDLRVTHWHDDGKRYPAPDERTADGLYRAECEDCHVTTVVNKDAVAASHRAH